MVILCEGSCVPTAGRVGAVDVASCLVDNVGLCGGRRKRRGGEGPASEVGRLESERWFRAQRSSLGFVRQNSFDGLRP